MRLISAGVVDMGVGLPALKRKPKKPRIMEMNAELNTTTDYNNDVVLDSFPPSTSNQPDGSISEGEAAPPPPPLRSIHPLAIPNSRRK
ncbi:unnamed protein product, partial [Mesorhabditis spiculigera]